MELLLLLAVIYFVVKNLPKKNTIVVDGKVIEELPILDGTMTPAQVAGQGIAEDAKAKAESIVKSLSTPVPSTTLNPALVPALIIERNIKQVSEAYRQCVEGFKKKTAGGPIFVIEPEEMCRRLLTTPKIIV